MNDWITSVPPLTALVTDYPSLWLQTLSLLPGLTNDDRAKVMALVVGTCPHCYEGGRACQCSKDE